MPSSSSGIAGRAVKTCTECKQSKIRCDSKERFPNPCSRCETRQLFCNVDSSFKRMPARKRLEAMNKELQELRNRKHSDRQTPPSDFVAEDLPLEQTPVIQDAEDDFQLQSAVVSLYDNFIDPSIAVECFQTFARDYRPQLPITGPLCISKIHDAQPLLFWTIIVIVLTHSYRRDYDALAEPLRSPYGTFVREQAMQAPLPLSKIQALLLIIEWPLGVGTQNHDPSWLFSGLAIHAARFMSLDRQQMVPSYLSLGVAAGNAQARISTWLGCFYCTTSLSMHLGLPPPIDNETDFSAIHSMLRQNTVSTIFAMRVRVQLVVANFTSLLSRDENESSNLSLIRLFENELTALTHTGPGEGEDLKAVQLCILDAKMHIYALFITRGSQGSSSREIILRKALTVAVRIISLSTPDWRDDSDRRTTFQFREKQRTLPKNHWRCFGFATVFLLRFFHNSASASAEERELVANHISLAGEHFKACSMHERDEYHRTRKIFEVLARMGPAEVEKSTLRLTHRMGVSILFDAVTSAAEVRGRPTQADDEDNPVSSGAVDVLPVGIHDESTIHPEQLASDVEMLRTFWDDPILSMLNLGPASPGGSIAMAQ